LLPQKRARNGDPSPRHEIITRVDEALIEDFRVISMARDQAYRRQKSTE
jgi:hypothetical protein